MKLISVIILDMKLVNTGLVPKYLNLYKNYVEIAKEMVDNVAERPTFLKRTVTGDKTWVQDVKLAVQK